MKNEESGVPKSRTSSLLSMAAKIALKEGKNILQNRGDKRIIKMMEQADIIVRHVGQLKGAAMKAVQMLTVEAQDLLPPEVIRILEKLQSQAPPLSNELMLQNLKSELGEEKFNQLENISAEPIASASIGQVYKAHYKNKDVAIKVQYPGISESIDSDINTLKSLIKALNFITNKHVDLEDLFSEVRRILIQETNYHNEEKLLQEYQSGFVNENHYIIPDVYSEFTTNNVLVLEFKNGLEFTEWLKTNPKNEDKEKVGNLLLELYIKEFYENQLVQTDPNPANFLVTDSADLVLLDFGATVSYEDEFVYKYKNLVKTVFGNNDNEILKAVLDLNFLSPKESPETQQMFVDFLKLSLVPFEEERQPFDFSSMEYSNEVRQSVLEFTKKLKYSAPPKQLIFLHRKLGGIFQLLRKLEVQVDLTPFRNKVLSENLIKKAQ